MRYSERAYSPTGLLKKARSKATGKVIFVFSKRSGAAKVEAKSRRLRREKEFGK